MDHDDPRLYAHLIRQLQSSEGSDAEMRLGVNMVLAVLTYVDDIDEDQIEVSRQQAKETINEAAPSRALVPKHVRRPTDEELEQLREWHEMGLGYSAIANLVEGEMGIEVDRSTIYRYCNDDNQADKDD